MSNPSTDERERQQRTIFPTVKVPVLSEQSTDMQPKVSMVARFLTRTCRFAMRLATMVKESATQTGNPYVMIGVE